MRKIILLFILVFCGQLLAQSAEEAVDLLYDQQGFGLRAAAMGNAYNAVADDYSAIYWNPAGLAQIHSGEIYASLYNHSFNNSATMLGKETNGSQSFTRFQSLGFVYPFAVERGSLVLAFGYQKIKDFDSHGEFSGHLSGSNDLSFNISNDLGDYGDLYFDRDLDQKMAVSSNGNLSQWSVAMAIDLSPRFSAGATLSLVSGKNEYNNEYVQTDPNSQNSYDIFDENNQKIEEFYYNKYTIKQNLISEFSGFEAKVGGLFRLNENIRLGGTITLPMTLRVDETWDLSDELLYDIKVLQDNVIYQYEDRLGLDDGTFDYNIKVPFKFSGGISYSNDLFLVSASGDYRDWTQMKYEIPDGRNSADYTYLMDENKYFLEDFRPALSYALGGEFRLLKGLINLRGGFRYVPSPIKNADAKMDKKYYTAGIGLQADENTKVELSYRIASWEAAKYYNYGYGDWTPGKIQTYEKYNSNKLQLGVKINF